MVLGERSLDTRAARRELTRARILETAWKLARRDGLGALSLHAIAQHVGMRAPSLYTYFPSKNAIYDAMYADAASQLAATLAHRPNTTDPVERLRSRVRQFVDFCTTDPIRYQLVFERPIPGFEPTPDAFEITATALSSTRADLEAVGVHGERALDLFRALFTGLVSLQIANDPGGRRWTRLQDEALEMFLARHANPVPAGPRKPRRRQPGVNTHSQEIPS